MPVRTALPRLPDYDSAGRPFLRLHQSRLCPCPRQVMPQVLLRLSARLPCLSAPWTLPPDTCLSLCLLCLWGLPVRPFLGPACILFQEASATSTPLVHIQHPVLRFAPSTIKRYMADWRSWAAFCAALSASPSDPPPGALPDWLASRASKQGLATGPLRALSWFARIAGLPSLQARLQVSVVRAFATASAPSERRESLPLPLSFVVWMERRVADTSTHPSEALFLGFLLTAVWASLRWGDLLWTPAGILRFHA